MQANKEGIRFPIPRSWGQQRWTRMLPLLVTGLIALVGVSSLFDTIFDRIVGPRLDDYRSETAKLEHIQLPLSDTQEALLAYTVDGRLATLEQFLSGKKVIAIQPFLPEIDGLVSARSGTIGSVPASRDFDDLQADWEKLIRLGGGHTPTQADIAPLTSSISDLSDRLKSDIGSYIEQVATLTARPMDLIDTDGKLLAYFNIACVLFAILAMIYAFRNILSALDSGLVAKKQVDQLTRSCGPTRRRSCRGLAARFMYSTILATAWTYLRTGAILASRAATTSARPVAGR